MNVCADVILSNGEESVRGLNRVLRENPAIREEFEQCECQVCRTRNVEDRTNFLHEDVLRSTNIFDYICQTCCTPDEDADLICPPNVQGPKFIKLLCVGCAPNRNDRCQHCGVKQRYPELNHCPVWRRRRENAFATNVWEEDFIPGVLKKQMVMISKSLTLSELVDNFEEALGSARQHYTLFRWCGHQRKLMQVLNDPQHSIVICTDFGSVMDIISNNVDNNHVPQRMIRAIYFIYSAQETIIYDDENGQEKTHISVKCDVRHYLSSPIKTQSQPGQVVDKTGGKSQDSSFLTLYLNWNLNVYKIQMTGRLCTTSGQIIVEGNIRIASTFTTWQS